MIQQLVVFGQIIGHKQKIKWLFLYLSFVQLLKILDSRGDLAMKLFFLSLFLCFFIVGVINN